MPHRRSGRVFGEKAMSDRKQEAKLDDALDDSFPASDPLPNTPVGGTKKSHEIEDARADKAGEAVPKGTPTSDRAATEKAGE